MEEVGRQGESLFQLSRGLYIDENRNQLVYEMPLSEIIFEYFDKLKSVLSFLKHLGIEDAEDVTNYVRNGC